MSVGEQDLEAERPGSIGVSSGPDAPEQVRTVSDTLSSSIDTRAPHPPDLDFLETVFEAPSVGLAVLAGEPLRFRRVNGAYRRFLPDPRQDPVGRTFDEVWRLTCDAEAVYRRVLETGEPSRRDDFELAQPGGPRWFTAHARRVTHAGAPAVLLSLWDTNDLVAARKSAEASLELALSRTAELEAVIDAFAEGFVLFDADGKVIRANEHAVRISRALGILKAYADPAGAGVRFLDAEGRPVEVDDLPSRRALRGEMVHGTHVRARGRERTLFLRLSAAPVRTPEGGVSGAVLTMSDQTELKNLEEARDELIQMISHDLRTPLNAVYNQAHLIRRGSGDQGKTEERAGAIIRSCERMSTMIRDLVETTLLETGRFQLEKADVDLAAVLPELVERLRGGLDVDRIELLVRPGVPRTRADPARLERVVVNLLSNALKYSPAQTAVTLRVEAGRGGLLLAVEDRGVGIAPEDQPHIFERFFRARGARRPEGLGLGLYITRLLVEAHGGRIRVESALGRGSTFTVFLPQGA